MNLNLQFFTQEDFLFALRNVVLAQIGVSELSNRTGLGRESLYKSLSPTANPYLSTVLKVLNELGFVLQVAPRKDHEPIPSINRRPNSLSQIYPELAKQWHVRLNNGLTSDDVTINSKRRIKHGCPICAGKKAVLSNSLSISHAYVAQEWHPYKNNSLTASEVTAGSGKKIWWKCARHDDHEWEASVYSRTMGKGCPTCAGRKVGF